MDPVLLSRIQFALTIGFHFIFPPVSIGLAWMLVPIEYKVWRTGDEGWERLGRFFAKLLAITFAVGVATGIVMEFQFGTNWANYSKFVGDIFGAPLAAEGVFAFFLESGFLGLYLFGRNRVSRRLHWFSILMVAFGATLSAFWIIVANSWQQTPAGFIVQNGRAELVDFWAAVFNPSTVWRYLHTMDAAVITGAFMVMGVSSYLILKDREAELAKRTLRLGLIVGLVASLLELMPFGHHHARQVAETQPAKFAAIEGLYETSTNAPLVLFGVPDSGPPAKLILPVEISGLAGWLAFGDADAHVPGLDQFPPDEIPPLWLTFVSFHNMVVLGMFFIAITALGLFLLWRKKLFDTRWILWTLVLSIPLPVAACQLGWITAEVGRQPWIVYPVPGVFEGMKVADAISPSVTAPEILASIIMFGLVYLLLGTLYVFLMWKKGSAGPEPLPTSVAREV
jgi:cytochrome bd ubiquinol oxidase subunit I